MPAWHSGALENATAIFGARHSAVVGRSLATGPITIVDAVLNTSATGKWAAILLLVWAIGFLVFVARIVWGLLGLIRIASHAEPMLGEDWRRRASEICLGMNVKRRVRLLQSARETIMPVTWGALRPTVLLPASSVDWSEERKRSVLIHELAHIARLDWFMQIFAELAQSIYWFHPLAWIAARELRRESERACDDSVLNSGVKPSEYARQLLDLAMTLENSGNRWLSALAIARQTSLERRFTAMLHPSTHRGSLSKNAKALVCVAVLFVLLPLAALRLPAQDTGRFDGSISDPSGMPIANATIALDNHKTNQVQMTTSDQEGKYTFVGLPSGEYELRVMKEGFAELRATIVTIGSGHEAPQNITLQVSPMNEAIDVVVPGGVKEGVKGGIEGGVSGGLKTNDSAKMIRLRIGGEVQSAKIVEKVPPVYPDKARTAGIDGTVILHAVIGMDGRPLSLKVMNNQIDPDLARAAVEAVSKWRYRPTLLNGEPIEVDTTVMVNFKLVK